ncbi:hypothetical protein ACH5RR_009780 [Cinchona calisaya]|uniref:Uncharacterized protein n=1 Tax=Cinchona calisaya TaxID=153742 RepID=A0ABD3AFZ0_9GENT
MPKVSISRHQSAISRPESPYPYTRDMLPMRPLSTAEWMELLGSSDINEYSMLDDFTWLCLAVLSTTTALVGLRQVILPFWKSDARYLGFTADLYVFPHFLKIAYDISIWDILFGLVMQIVGFMVARNIYTVTPFLLIYAGVIFYRYMSYSPPQIPDCDKEPSGSVN